MAAWTAAGGAWGEAQPAASGGGAVGWGGVCPRGGRECLLAAAGPGVAEGAPLGEAGFIAKEQEGAAALGLGQDRRPGLLPPDAAALGVQVVGDEAGLLVAVAQIAQQGGQVVMVVE